MKLSDKRLGDVYAAIADPIEDLRLTLELYDEKIDPLALDAHLLKLAAAILGEIKEALNIQRA